MQNIIDSGQQLPLQIAMEVGVDSDIDCPSYKCVC